MSDERTHGGTIIRAKVPHRCTPPDPLDYAVGTVFVCDCGRHHVVTDEQNYMGGRYWTLER